MGAKDGLLSLGWLLIALLNAQLLQAYAGHRFHENAYSGERWSYTQPQRPLEYQHHASHHRHGHHPNLHYNPTDAQIGHAPSFGGGQYSGGQARDVYAGQAGAGHSRDGVANQAQPVAGYGCVCGQLPETANGQGQAGFGNPVWSRYPETAPARPFEQRPLPNPLDYENEQRNPTEPNSQPSDPNYLQPGFTGSPLQPRPKPSGQDLPEPNYLQPGFTGNPLQPHPQPGGLDPSHTDYLQPGFTGNPLQPRPQPGGQSPSEHSYIQPGFTGRPLQPRPEGQANDEFEFQTSGTVIPQRSNTANLLQPRPEVAANGEEFNPSYQNVPEPKSDQRNTVDDNIASIFKTDFTFRNQNEGNEAQGSKDPKSKAVITQPESIGERNLFDTNPVCPEGTELRSGRCRQKA
ncbi:sporozoite surface protein 2 isoform X1 [Drosophila mojavensis]|uniref:sporozoite surface protein 2 isoform X1 n=1 Tax=Drosophila mojavensis TaxID=7230 RepID=UPI001CD11D73|nr:sporozoite surface protein 2 isoform X1 [Drosophila mojavensis]